MKQPSLYEVLVRKLYMTNMFNPVKLGLKNMEELHNLMNKPMDRENLLIVHVAGTNGKGSVCYKVAKTFQLAGYKTGLFTRYETSYVGNKSTFKYKISLTMVRYYILLYFLKIFFRQQVLIYLPLGSGFKSIPYPYLRKKLPNISQIFFL